VGVCLHLTKLDSTLNSVLQNKKSALPLSVAASARKVALIGPSVDIGAVLLGDYADMASPAVSIAAAAPAALPAGVNIVVARGCVTNACQNMSGFAAAEEAAKGADFAILQVRCCVPLEAVLRGSFSMFRANLERVPTLLPSCSLASAAMLAVKRTIRTRKLR
jgi:hypothetical protein